MEVGYTANDRMVKRIRDMLRRLPASRCVPTGIYQLIHDLDGKDYLEGRLITAESAVEFLEMKLGELTRG